MNDIEDNYNDGTAPTVQQLQDTNLQLRAEIHQLRLEAQQNITGRRRTRQSINPADIGRPTRLREADPNDTFTFSIEKVIKQLRDKPKFTGVGKTPSQELFKLFGNIKVALDTVDAPSEYSSILDLDREETYSGRVNKHLYVILYNITEDSAASIVEQSASDSDGRQAWKALNHQYLPVGTASAELNC